jgi:dihydroorotate dehydrogenase
MNAYHLLRPALFRLPPERAHKAGVAALNAALATPAARAAARARYAVDDARLRVERFGIRFPNPVGLAAGFDKSAESFNALGALGFGHVEVGTVTALAQPGNPQPRLFRLPEDDALLNRMGFNNPGAEAVAARLARARIEPVLGINIGKSKAAPLEDATADYLRSFDLLAAFARYVAVNVSSPNTPGLRALQDAGPLRELLRALRTRADERAGGIPILLKIAPDLGDAQVEEVAGIALEEGIAGIIATNTTVSRAGLHGDVDALGAGGVSGAPVRARARAVVARVFHMTGGRVPVVGVGGVFTAEDAWKMIVAGASLVQVWTGFVYRGPAIARDVNAGLLRYLERFGLRSVDEAVGLAHR